ncbi:polysaccharide deacetylase family protein [Roseospira goensis]|uniref:Uncharacterized protein n=1 Tax=Roseospira goensis TaxID=391922 RepID=A0A7W6WL80_9PROT|nr:hypothetical protein [Roseospira goensis]MBB4286529.1 hypothetical protein [Roseospira goensis]
MMAMAATGGTMARTILALEHPSAKDARDGLIHAVAEFPLNHLGLVVRHHSLLDPLPDPDTLGDVRAVLTWLRGETLPDAAALLRWAVAMQARGVRFVVLGDLPFTEALNTPETHALAARFLATLGVRAEDRWIAATYGVTFPVREPWMMDYERRIGGILPGYPVVRPAGGDTRSWLVARTGEDATLDSHLVVTGPGGGFAAAGYELFTADAPSGAVPGAIDPLGLRAWLIDPFLFFGQALGLDGLPRPDVTTLVGRRLYFSHIDGDGWNSKAELPGYEERGAIAAEVILREVIAPCPDLPVTVGPIAAELDPDWRGGSPSQEMARALFALPQVEPASHTYTHPFHWAFFADYTPEKEAPFIAALAERGTLDTYDGGALDQEILDLGATNLADGYARPRAFMDAPFDLETEMGGAAAFIGRFAPPDKPVRVVLWSGDTTPFPEALAVARADGLLAINGGDTRYDSAFPSVAWVSPIGCLTGGECQIYTAASNENTYTDLWRDRFFGFRYLTETWDRSGTPARLKPINLYYHMYSGSKVASLNALLHNLDYVRTQPVCPVTTSHYVRIAGGFFDVTLVEVAPARWRVEQRGALQTLRFDAATVRAVDMAASVGVLGQRHAQGSLYVALDSAVVAPEVALMDWPTPDRAPPGAAVPYVIESRWPLWGLTRTPGGVTVQAQGFGDGTMAWQVAPGARTHVTVTDADGAAVVRTTAVADAEGRLDLTLPPVAMAGATVTLRFGGTG